MSRVRSARTKCLSDIPNTARRPNRRHASAAIPASFMPTPMTPVITIFYRRVFSGS